MLLHIAVCRKLYENKKIAHATHNMYAYRIYVDTRKAWLQVSVYYMSLLPINHFFLSLGKIVSKFEHLYNMQIFSLKSVSGYDRSKCTRK